MMIPLQKDLQQRARKAGLPLDTVAKDYVIGYLLPAISVEERFGRPGGRRASLALVSS
jgi:hypothetical protein